MPKFNSLPRLLLLFLFSFSVNMAHGFVENSKLAPNFTLINEEGKSVELYKNRGKTVVLEWYNRGCPFVKKHYGSQNMQKLQDKWTKKGVIWLSIISSAKGKQGFLTQSEALVNKTTSGSLATSILLDKEGKVGKMYGAKTTPHMFIINKKGILVYQGAIDSNDSYDPAVIPESKNYVDQVLTNLYEKKKFKHFKVPAYGCGVKY